MELTARDHNLLLEKRLCPYVQTVNRNRGYVTCFGRHPEYVTQNRPKTNLIMA
jgi:hypothetical protein